MEEKFALADSFKIRPGFCCLGVTNKCMLKCRMCHKWKDEVKEAYPTLAHYKKFLSDLRELVDKGFIINFGGGETLLFEGLFDLIKFSSELGFTTNTISNGWLIDEEMSKRIGDSGLDGINLSLDSLNEATHDYLRGVKGVHRRVMNAIEYLNKYRTRTKVGLCCVIYDWNLDEIPFLLDWALANEALDSILFMVPMQPNSTGIAQKWWEGEYGFLWPRNTDKACAFIDSLLQHKAMYPHKIGNTIAQLEAFKLYLRFPEKFVKKTKCNLDRAVHVSAAGDIFLCFRWAELGTIRHAHDIRQLWYSERARDVRKNIAGCRDNCHFLLNCFFEGDYPFELKEDRN
jgi:MoaA/NifB/PqqE/SkfB family radical SAM enzyme